MSAASSDLVFASALSTAAPTSAAAEELISSLTQQSVAPVDVLFIFSSMHHREHLDELAARLREAFQPRTLLAVTCEGIIGMGREVEQGPALSVVTARLPGVTLEPFHYGQIDFSKVLRTPEALRQSIRSAGNDTPLRAILMLADPFSTPLVKLLPAFGKAFPGVPVVGGMASGGRKPQENRLMLNHRLFDAGAVGLAIGGDIDVRTTVSQGCRPVGRPLIITKAQRHVVQELGGRNALEVVQEMAQDFDPHDQHLVETTGLLVGRVINEYKGRFGRGDFLIRGLVGVDTNAGYIAIGDPQVRVGQTVQFHVRDQKTATEDLSMLLELQKIHGPGSGALLFTCNGRGSKLFERPDADAAMVRDALGETPLGGCFCAGELGPVGEENFVHGHTASLVVFRRPQQGPVD